MTSRAEQAALDRAAESYDPAPDGYDLAKDPRCLFGWGPPERRCRCRSGHACFRALGHPGQCHDPGARRDHDLPCAWTTRPRDWDAKLRAEANA